MSNFNIKHPDSEYKDFVKRLKKYDFLYSDLYNGIITRQLFNAIVGLYMKEGLHLEKLTVRLDKMIYLYDLCIKEFKETFPTRQALLDIGLNVQQAHFLTQGRTSVKKMKLKYLILRGYPKYKLIDWTV